jgi:hypothetical protein
MAVIRAGETLIVEVLIEAESLTARAVGTQNYSLTVSRNGNIWKLSADTTSWGAGRYLIGGVATLTDGTKRSIPEDYVEVLPSLASITGGTDLSTDAEKMVSYIEAMLMGNASQGVRRYKINNRELERYGVDELLRLLNYFKGQVVKESRKRRGASILGGRIEVRV